MREILFKGKRTDNGEWVEGIPIKTHIGTFIVFEENPHFCNQYGYMEIDGLCKVFDETVCQFIDFFDKNEKKFFEGDYWIDEDGDYLVVEYRNGQYCFAAYGYDDELFGFDGFGELDCVPLDYYYLNQIEIVGNIHDNSKIFKK